MPTDLPFLKMIYEGAKITISRKNKPKTKNKPLTPEIIKKIVDVFAESPSLPTMHHHLPRKFRRILKDKEAFKLKNGTLTICTRGVKLNITPKQTNFTRETLYLQCRARFQLLPGRFAS